MGKQSSKDPENLDPNKNLVVNSGRIRVFLGSRNTAIQFSKISHCSLQSNLQL